MTTQMLTTNQAAQRDVFVERLLQSTAGTFEMFSIYLGHRLGLYQALANGQSFTSVELAQATQTNERYIREWLEQQTVVGIITVENPAAGSRERRFHLPAPHIEVLTDETSGNYLTPLALMLAGAVRPLESTLHAYRRGGGVPYSEYGVDFLQGQGAINRPMFMTELGQAWLPTIPDVHARLQADPPARIADFGCGVGWSSIGMAQAYPNAQVDGFDLDAPSIEMARKNAAEASMNGRLKFHVRDAGDPSLAGQYDLVTAFECIHDVSDPVGVLRTMRRLVNGSGAVIVADERVGDAFTPEGNDVEWMMYGWSILHCLPVGMADEHSAETGTVMRIDTLRRYAREAGFREVEVLPIDNFFLRIYRLVA